MSTIKKKRTRPTYFNTKRTIPLTGHRAFLITTFKNLCPFEDGSSLESWIYDLFDYVHEADKKVKKYHLNNWIKNKPWITDFEVNERRPVPVQNEGEQDAVVLSAATDVVPPNQINQTPNSIQLAETGLALIDTLIDHCKTLNIPLHNVQLRPLARKFQHLIKNPHSGESEAPNLDEVVLNDIKQEPREDGQ